VQLAGNDKDAIMGKLGLTAREYDMLGSGDGAKNPILAIAVKEMLRAAAAPAAAAGADEEMLYANTYLQAMLQASNADPAVVANVMRNLSDPRAIHQMAMHKRATKQTVSAPAAPRDRQAEERRLFSEARALLASESRQTGSGPVLSDLQVYLEMERRHPGHALLQRCRKPTNAAQTAAAAGAGAGASVSASASQRTPSVGERVADMLEEPYTSLAAVIPGAGAGQVREALDMVAEFSDEQVNSKK
jgi:hypothetical protein